ncbi:MULTISPECIES: TRAP transporter permease [unclassified Sedimentibacter]|uniref:TRAP transporter permease n=1 Tax=unclassified Sedimentibacter TaxID=2649220 RepID=UPI0027E043B3|nr:TRAP transporter permease [Sedimentibacter sp. MB35-C1]WMJ76949.1 TRAP transporter permease [Sedimentibacter sp. MB35-C1]
MKIEKQSLNFKSIIKSVAIVMSCYHLYTGAFGIPESQVHRYIHLLFALILSYGSFSIKRDKVSKVKIFDIVLIVLSVVTLGYLIVTYKVLQNRILFVTPLTIIQKVTFVLILVLVLEATRRLTGWTLPIVCIVFLLYALFGDRLPGMLSHTGFSFTKILEQLALTSEGIFGSALGITATYVIMFIIFASFLEVTGAGQFFIDLSTGVTGSKRGGPAKVAVVASALFGSISGSSVANVVSTGTFTIPLIKSVGYSPVFAGAVEAVASSGGQIMPPIMAAVAFIMADYLGVSYMAIVKAALIPALLYYFCLFFMVDARAVKLNIKGLSKESLPNTKDVLSNGWYMLIPFVVLVGLMMAKYTPMIAGFYALVTLIAVFLVKNRKILTLQKMLLGLEGGAKSILSVSVTSACAGIIVGVIMLTGLGLKFTSLIVVYSNGNLVLAMFFSAIVAIILGMGLPTVPAYIVMSSLVAPALIQMGAIPIAAHMFVLYFSVISCITPPVAIASYAAAAISDADPMKVGVQSVKLGIVAYIVPFLFVLNPILLSQGNLIAVLWTFSTALLGCMALTWGIEGVVSKPISVVNRIINFIAAFLLLYPEGNTDIIGLLLFIWIIYSCKYKVYKENLKLSVTEN